ncbi:MAG: hypothetical protein JWL67_1998 [Solirubrobacterales bacterium]|nr:hypothetical protein [Solirubrobacterales bacterium]
MGDKLGKKLLVLVTVHGIGFEQPATADKEGNLAEEGYADALHAGLKEVLPELGHDPQPPHTVVYVKSSVDGSTAEGLKRLREPLVADGTIAHVALVYAPLEPATPEFGPVLGTLGRAIISLRKYATIPGFLKLLARDLWALFRGTSSPPPPPLEGRTGHPPLPSLRPRTDLRTGLLRRRRSDKPPKASTIIRALAVDVATYVELNMVRERVRGFVQNALLTILACEDVEAVVINAHSQGTVVCWDVLARLPFYTWQDASPKDPAGEKLCAFVTAGSPIRKYIDLFTWGPLVGQLAARLEQPVPKSRWVNFWDPRDPVADPLDPAQAWRPGEPIGEHRGEDIGLLVGRNPSSGEPWHVTVDDRQVDNVHQSRGGGLQAHSYWDNRGEFVQELADILRGCHPANSDERHPNA